MDAAIAARRAVVFWDKKWEKFISRSWPFRYIPFVEFVFGAGSLAYGNVRQQSDFDVIVGVRKGRIFTARLFCVVLFGMFGWRRSRLSHDEDAADKICLNHFVTERAYRFSPPHSSSWRRLYRSLVPIYGDVKKINDFWNANADWMGSEKIYHDDLRHTHTQPHILKKAIEMIYAGAFGNMFEQFARGMQIRKIERSLHDISPGRNPRITYTDDELEFHPDTKRVEDRLRAQ